MRKKGENNIKLARKTAIYSTEIMISPLGIESQRKTAPSCKGRSIE
jgi:hypothetical protein